MPTLSSLRSTLTLCAYVLAIIFGAMAARAQDARFRVERISTRGGQLAGSVYAVMQDRFGFIWFGTVDGLQRYDGNALYSYRYDPFDTTGLSDYRVAAIAEDSAGYIWAGTDAGLNRLDRRSGRFTRFVHDPRNPGSISNSYISSLVADHRGGVWVGTRSGIDYVDGRSGRVVRYDSASFDRNITAWVSLYRDRNGGIWVGNRYNDFNTSPLTVRTSIGRYDPASDRFTHWAIPPAIAGTPRIIGDHPDGRIDIEFYRSISDGGALVQRFDPGTGRMTALDVPLAPGERRVGAVRSALLGEADECWYAAQVGASSAQGAHMLYGIYHEPLSSVEISSAIESRRLHHPILTGFAHTAYRDRSGTIWIGMEDGVVRISRIGAGFTTWRHDPSDQTTLSARRIRAVHVDRSGQLWAATDFGLNRFDRSSGRWQRFFSDITRPGSLPNSTVNVIYDDPRSGLLFGTNGGLGAYDQANGRFGELARETLTAEGSPIAIWSLLRDRRGDLWVGTGRHGLVRFDSTGKLLGWFRHEEGRDGSILSGGVWSLFEDRHGTIWVGTNEGLCRWLPASGTFASYTHRGGDARSIGGKRIWALYEDRAGDLWVSSFGGGLGRYNRASDDFTTITTRDGLPDNGVFGALEDDAGIFWISTARGLVRWDRTANTFRLYDADDGLQGNEFAFKAFFKSSEGTLYFGGTEGLSAFRPEELTENRYPPPMAITAFHLFDSLVASELFDGDTVRLDYRQNFFSFTFAALDYINPGKNRYAYMLEGVDPDWVRTGSDQRVASYTDLAPGVYTFRVRGSNNDGVWNERGMAVTVIIAPPWWKSLWFRIGAGVLAVAVMIASVGKRIQTIRRDELRKREEQEREMRAALESQELERQRIARDLHDGVGQLLAAAGITMARLKGMIDRDGVESAELRVPLERAMEIVGRAGVDVRSISHALGTSTVRELGLVAALAELLATFDANGQTRITLSTVGMERRLPEALETGLFRIAQELVANVLRHAEASEATVQIIRREGEIELTVEDNGKGFDASSTNGGMGRRNIAARVAALGGRLHYDSTPGHGTTVTVVIEE